MKSLLNSVATLAAGAAVMYYLDPQMGRRRRATLRDKLHSGQRQAASFAGTQAKRTADQARGLYAKAHAQSSRIFDGGGEPVDDTVLAERVRAQLGRLTSRPGAIDVTASGGCIGLSGHVLAAEHTPLVQTISAISGVSEVDDRLVVHDQPGNVPELQGGAPHPA
ncbi:BON domain-containing protein [Trinickia diaoshuihuensis]|jgi:osmotically-inducible protein OsmY|uniref:BON domain-containing protein n=1 Tax=Trinickia diaoshuihuensis TaxID=2292265 RepID=UPI000E254A18|nr:BON domain-containing protein [Trinickia diaoshuihuensis]